MPASIQLKEDLVSTAVTPAEAAQNLTQVQGVVRCVVSNYHGDRVSSAATLTVFMPVVAPAITTQPVSTTVVKGRTSALRVTTTGTAPLHYQWLREGQPLLNSARVSGAETPALTITVVQPEDAGADTMVATNSAGRAASFGR